MVIGDKCVLVNHPFYNGRYGRIIDIDSSCSQYKICVDIDGKNIWVPYDQVDAAIEESEYYDEHYSKMKVQPIMLAQDVLTPEEMIGAMKFNIIKYALRAGEKVGEPAEKDQAKKERYQEWLNTLYKGQRIIV